MNHRGPHIFVTLIFTGILLSAGGLQLGVELRRGERPQLLELFSRTPTVAHLRAYEQDLEDASWLAGRLRPWMQYAQYVLLKDTGEKALRGPNGWFFYKPGVEYLTQRKPVRTDCDDPVGAVCDLRDQLAARGIHLVLVPVPNKESVYPEQLSRRARGLPIAMCEQTQSFMRRLRAAEVEIVDLFELYARERSAASGSNNRHLYLPQDSHWSPAGLELAAQVIAQRLVEQGWIKPGRTLYQAKSAPTKRLGDVVRMLNVPQIEKGLGAERALCAQVVHPGTNQPYQDDPQSEILVMGDSFLRIFQQDEPGSAGFIAHLAKELQQPVASLVNDGGASTLVRQELYRRPALLENKKVVIWEFVERDIRFGTEGWQRVPLPPEPRAVMRRSRRESRLSQPLDCMHLKDVNPEAAGKGKTMKNMWFELRVGALDVAGVMPPRVSLSAQGTLVELYDSLSVAIPSLDLVVPRLRFGLRSDYTIREKD